MKKNLIIAVLFAASTLAHATGAGNGSAGSGSDSSGGSQGAQGYGKADLGYFPNWQTMNPIEREKLVDAQPKLPSQPSAKAEWPAWVQRTKGTNDQLVSK